MSQQKEKITRASILADKIEDSLRQIWREIKDINPRELTPDEAAALANINVQITDEASSIYDKIQEQLLAYEKETSK